MSCRLPGTIGCNRMPPCQTVLDAIGGFGRQPSRISRLLTVHTLLDDDTAASVPCSPRQQDVYEELVRCTSSLDARGRTRLASRPSPETTPCPTCRFARMDDHLHVPAADAQGVAERGAVWRQAAATDATVSKLALDNVAIVPLRAYYFGCTRPKRQRPRYVPFRRCKSPRAGHVRQESGPGFSLTTRTRRTGRHAGNLLR